MSLDAHGRTLLVHHWDTDGICSARLLLEELRGVSAENRTPRIGNYFLTEEELVDFSGYDTIIIADMALPVEDVLRLAEGSEVTIFDHHIQPPIESVNQHNPIAMGAKPDDYPSASWVVSEFLGREIDLYTLLGMVGDREHRIKENERFWPIISEFCLENGMVFDDMLRMVELLDSNYKTGDKRAVEMAPQLLESDGPSDILENKEWNRNVELLEEEMERLMNLPSEDISGVTVKRISTQYNIISALTRKIAWESSRSVIVVNGGFFEDSDQLYGRSPDRDMRALIERAVGLGFKAGGKKDVMGAIVPKEETEGLLKEVLEYLG